MGNRIEVQRYVSLCVAILGIVLCGGIGGFNTYAVALKQTFNYTQTELEYIAISGITGLRLTSFVSGVVMDRFGPQVACVIAAVLSGSCFALMAISTTFKPFFASRSWIMCLLYFFAGSGNSFSFMSKMGTISLNFEGRYRGNTIIGLASAMAGVSQLLFAVIYNGFFVQGHITDEENQNLRGFYILLSSCAVCENLLGAAFLQLIPAEDTSKLLQDENEGSGETNVDEWEQRNKRAGDDDSSNSEENRLSDETLLFQKDDDDGDLSANITCFQMIKGLKFHIFVWIVIIVRGTGSTITANISSMAKSAHLEMASPALVMIMPIFNTLARFVGGSIPDILKFKLTFIPVSSLLLFASFLMMVTQILLIFYNQSLVGLVCFSVMTSISTGFISVTTPITILQFFGNKDFSQKFGLVLTLAGLAVVPFAKLFGFIYDMYSIPGSQTCYGVHCSRWAYVINAIVAFISTLLSVVLVKVERNQTCRNV